MATQKVDALLTMKDHIAAFSVLLTGEFTDKIAEVEQMLAELKTTKDIVDTAGGIDAYKKSADDYYKTTVDQANQLMTEVQTAKDKLAKQQADLAAQKAELVKNKEDFDAAKAALTADKAAFEASIASTVAETNAAKSKAVDDMVMYSTMKTNMEKLQAELQSKLDIIKGL